MSRPSMTGWGIFCRTRGICLRRIGTRLCRGCAARGEERGAGQNRLKEKTAFQSGEEWDAGSIADLIDRLCFILQPGDISELGFAPRNIKQVFDGKSDLVLLAGIVDRKVGDPI